MHACDYGALVHIPEAAPAFGDHVSDSVMPVEVVFQEVLKTTHRYKQQHISSIANYSFDERQLLVLKIMKKDNISTLF